MAGEKIKTNHKEMKKRKIDVCFLLRTYWVLKGLTENLKDIDMENRA